MKDPSGALLTALRHLARSSSYAVALADAVILGKPSVRRNALQKLPGALDLLRRRVAQAATLLAQEDSP